jgi:hypothetical protein
MSFMTRVTAKNAYLIVISIDPANNIRALVKPK